MSDQQAAPETAPVETTDAPQTETQAPQEGAPQLGIDPALDARLNELGQSIGQLTQGFQQMQEAQYEDPYQSQQQYQSQYGQEQQDPYNGLDPNDPRDQMLIQSQQQLQEMRQSQDRFAHETWLRDINALEERIPALKDPAVGGPVVEHAKQLAQAMGFDPNGRIPPMVLETAYGKFQADKIAAGQQPIQQVQGQQATLEGAGATPQQPAQDPMDTYFPAEAPQQRSVFGI